jgi:hypothetical protein
VPVFIARENIELKKIIEATRKGQTTTLTKIRDDPGIKKGDNLSVETVDHAVISKRIPKIEDCAGIFAGHADVTEMKRKIDKLREEY